MSVHGGDVREAAREFGINESDLLDFSSNINPRGLPPRALAALTQALDPKLLTRYPDRSARELRKALGEYLGVAQEALVIGPGAEALLAPALRAFGCRTLSVPVPAFGEYRRVCTSEGVDFVPLPLDRGAGFRLAPDSLPRGGVLLLNNPHNPSGALIEVGRMRRISQESALIVDEAFIDYAPEHTLARDAAEKPALIVIRSLTKFFGCPALRVGYAVAHPDTARRMSKWLPAWPVTQPVMDALAEALRDHEFAEATLRENAVARASFCDGLQTLGLGVVPSAANYLLAELRVTIPDVTSLRLRLACNHRILIRNCDSYEDIEPGRWFRVAVRTAAENQRLLDALACELQRL